MKGDARTISHQVATVIAQVDVPSSKPPYRPMVFQLCQINNLQGRGDFIVLRNDFKQGSFGFEFFEEAKRLFMAEVQAEVF